MLKSPLNLYFSLTLMLLPFLILGYFNFPSADDFTYAQSEIQNGFWLQQKLLYLNWSGRFVANVLLSLSPLSFGGLEVYKVFGTLNFLLFTGALYSLLSALVGSLLPRRQFFGFFLVFLSVCVSTIPSPVEAFYWQSGFVTYTWPFMLFLFTCGQYLRFRGWGFNLPKYAWPLGQTLRLGFLLSLTSLLVAGSNETLALTWILGLSLASLYDLIVRKKIEALLLLPWLIAVAALCVSILAPGNLVRQAELGFHPQVLSTIGKSIGLSLEIFFRYLRPPFLIALVLATPIALEAKHRVPSFIYSRRSRQINLVVFLFLSFLFVAPAMWAMGHSPPHRALNLLCCLHILFVSLMYFQLLWSDSPLAGRLLNLNTWLQKKFSPQQKGLALALSLLLFGNIGSAWWDLFAKAPGYAAQNQERLLNFKKHQGEDLVLSAYRSPPETLFFDDITTDPNDWRNRSLAFYFHLKSIRLEPANPEQK